MIKRSLIAATVAVAVSSAAYCRPRLFHLDRVGVNQNAPGHIGFDGNGLTRQFLDQGRTAPESAQPKVYSA